MAFSTSTTTTSFNERLTTLPLDRSDVFPATSILEYESSSTTLFYLTSLFTPPSECRDRPFTSSGPSYASQEPAMWDYEFGDSETLTCSHPEWISEVRQRFSSTFDGTRDITMTGVCPVGYETVGTREPASSAETYYYDSDEYNYMTIPITQAWCCPSGFTAVNFEDGLSPMNIFGCESVLNAPTTIYSLSENSTYSRSVTSLTVYDRGYFMEWNELQLPYFTPKSAPVVATATGPIHSFPQTIEMPTGLPSNTDVGSSGDDDESNSWHLGLSDNAIGGIIGGAAAGILAGMAGIWAWARHRRVKPAVQTISDLTTRSHGNKPASTVESPETDATVQELHGEDRQVLSGTGRQQLHAESLQQLHADSRPELHGEFRQELHSTPLQELHTATRYELDAWT